MSHLTARDIFGFQSEVHSLASGTEPLAVEADEGAAPALALQGRHGHGLFLCGVLFVSGMMGRGGSMIRALHWCPPESSPLVLGPTSWDSQACKLSSRDLPNIVSGDRVQGH